MEFYKFLQNRCSSLEIVRNSQVIWGHQNEIHFMSEEFSIGHHVDMWANDSIPNSICQFREWYIDSYAALPSNTQLAESTIKDSNYCQIPGHSDSLSSNMATARAGAVQFINSRVNKLAEHCRSECNSALKSKTALEFFAKQQSQGNRLLQDNRRLAKLKELWSNLTGKKSSFQLYESKERLTTA